MNKSTCSPRQPEVRPRVRLGGLRTSAPLPEAALLAMALLWLHGETEPLHAYVDPGSGSMLLQLLLGGTAGVLVFARLSGRRILTRLQMLFSRRPRGGA